jgi:hypothetical protein
VNDFADTMVLQPSRNARRDAQRTLFFFMEKPSIKVITMESLHSFDQIISNQRFFLGKDKDLKLKKMGEVKDGMCA